MLCGAQFLSELVFFLLNLHSHLLQLLSGVFKLFLQVLDFLVGVLIVFQCLVKRLLNLTFPFLSQPGV